MNSIFRPPYLPMTQVQLGNSRKPVEVWKTSFRRWDLDILNPLRQAYLEVKEEAEDCFSSDEILCRQSIACSVCYIGRTDREVKIAVVIHCANRYARSLARDMVGESDSWQRFHKSNPASMLMIAPKAPEPCTDDEMSGSLSAVSSNGILCPVGATVEFVHTADQSANDASSLGRARLGPTLFINNEPHIISVSHAFKKLQQQSIYSPPSESSTTASPSAISDPEEDDDDEVWEVYDDEHVQGETPSCIGLSSPPENTQVDSGANESIISRVRSLPETDVIQSVQATSHMPQSAGTTNTASDAVHDMVKVGEIAFRSSDEPLWQHDWALISPSERYGQELAKFGGLNMVSGPKPDRKRLRINETASTIKIAREVWLATSTEECEKGTLYPAPLWYKLPGSQRFLEVFRVDAQRPFLRGESGTAVLDAEDGSWYGHIIAADDDTRTAYMLLAVDIIRSIASTLNVSETSLSLTKQSLVLGGQTAISPKPPYMGSRLTESDSYLRRLTSMSLNPMWPQESTAKTALPQLFRHSPLLSKEPCIRLLKIQSRWGLGDIEADICHVPLEDAPAYRALSCVWEYDVQVQQRWRDQPNVRRIRVQDSYLPLPQTIVDAILVLHFPEPFYLWNDAICIKHGDPAEKTNQVSLMGNIYSQAQEVLIWLGKDGLNTNIAMDHLARISKARLDDTLYDLNKLVSLEPILQNEYWSGVWVLQDIILAKQVQIWCGPKHVEWNVLEDALSISALHQWHQHRISENFPFGTTSGASAHQVVAFNHLVYKLTSDQDKLKSKSLPLEALLWSYAGQTTKDPKDRIFALLGLAEDGTSIKIDYTAEMLDVCVNTAIHIIRKGKSLDTILRQVPSQEDTGFPSWVPDWMFASPWKLAAQGKNSSATDFLVGDPLSQPRYNASGSIKALGGELGPFMQASEPHLIRKRALKWQSRFYNMLASRGMIVGRLEKTMEWELGEPFWHLLLWKELERPDAKKMFCRTIVAGIDHNGNRCTPNWYDDAFTWLLESGHRPRPGDGKFAVETFCKRVDTAMRNRCVTLLSTDLDLESKFALVPEKAKSGDLLAILHGASVPVVLREEEKQEGLEDTENSSQAVYTLIGESYVHGIMDGEVLKLPGVKWQQIILA
ncbi:hypothetical protein PV10_04733 [Exophiala mesophila]|uniref:Heterokaryon incompatibility domain-containing protein n=1 Tax=Exophiala mesophila TaxID=212818 RepID=A0A0D2A3H8_EXOME|nr:uncharacterized protein PV10_04733 [Exophiala mesophila]KIV93523.1 hypothetical protein PV10_04733 [Exophiala mesophila]